MLFVVKCDIAGNFIIRDTDDNKDEQVNDTELGYAINSGLTIQGVELFDQGSMRDVFPYCPNPSLNVVKCRSLFGVNLVVNDGELVGIDERHILKGNHKVRLSQFCDRMSEFVMRKSGSQEKASLTLILDDKVEIHEKTFYNLFSMGLGVDISEVTNDKYADNLYNTTIMSSKSFEVYDSNIDRRRRWICIGIVCKDKKYFNIDFDIIKYSNFVFNFFKKYFDLLLGSNIYLYKQEALVYLRNKKFEDYDKPEKVPEVLDILCKMIDLNNRNYWLSLHYLRNYLTYFGCDNDALGIYLRFMEIFLNWCKQ